MVRARQTERSNRSPFMADFRDNVRGILGMLACCLAFIINDTMVKAAGDTLPLGQIVALRGALAVAVIGFMAWRAGLLSRQRELYSAPVGWRTLGEIASTVLYLGALMHIPIANASAIAQAAPLVMTAIGAFLLAERVGWRRWTAVAIGFCGILVIVRPGAEGFNLWSLVALASVFSVALRDFATRFVSRATPTLYVTFATTVGVFVTGVVMSLFEDWQPVGLNEALLLAGSAVTVLLGQAFSVVAMRNGDLSVVAPFRYSFIPYAIVIGWLVWGDVPDVLDFVGIVIVVATGVYTFMRERKHAASHRPATETAPTGI